MGLAEPSWVHEHIPWSASPATKLKACLSEVQNRRKFVDFYYRVNCSNIFFERMMLHFRLGLFYKKWGMARAVEPSSLIEVYAVTPRPSSSLYEPQNLTIPPWLSLLLCTLYMACRLCQCLVLVAWLLWLKKSVQRTCERLQPPFSWCYWIFIQSPSTLPPPCPATSHTHTHTHSHCLALVTQAMHSVDVTSSLSACVMRSPW